MAKIKGPTGNQTVPKTVKGYTIPGLVSHKPGKTFSGFKFVEYPDYTPDLIKDGHLKNGYITFIDTEGGFDKTVLWQKTVPGGLKPQAGVHADNQVGPAGGHGGQEDVTDKKFADIDYAAVEANLLADLVAKLGSSDPEFLKKAMHMASYSGSDMVKALMPPGDLLPEAQLQQAVSPPGAVVFNEVVSMEHAIKALEGKMPVNLTPGAKAGYLKILKDLLNRMRHYEKLEYDQSITVNDTIAMKVVIALAVKAITGAPVTGSSTLQAHWKSCVKHALEMMATVTEAVNDPTVAVEMAMQVLGNSEYKTEAVTLGHAADSTRKYLELSTAHIMWDTAQWLTTQATECAHSLKTSLASMLVVDQHGTHGWWVHVPPAEWKIDGIPDELDVVLNYARDRGCYFVLLDQDADEIPELSTFEW